MQQLEQPLVPTKVYNVFKAISTNLPQQRQNRAISAPERSGNQLRGIHSPTDLSPAAFEADRSKSLVA